jgi:hypothetical protein
MPLFHVSSITWAMSGESGLPNTGLPVALSVSCDKNDSASIYKYIEEKYGYKIATATIQEI